MSTSIVINQCQNCGVFSAKAAYRGLSSVLYRQIIKKIGDESEPLQALGLARDKLVQIILLTEYIPDGIEPFTTFYENYVNHVRNPMTKNFASRALGAIGLKARMLRIDFEGRKKSAMILRASAEELREMVC
ncbi:hypothetical protein GLOIN_2v1783702 [Rhizophagus irregularis DAOM 181602=DAOM 197198]|nr:hypothetical protein GLOIN_2v1783702 [Rhizophagus irregularis DAOM 181602=DAOM 197198]